MVVLKQLGAEPELVHCHTTLTLEALMNQAVTSEGVGGAGVIQSVVNRIKSYILMMNVPRAATETILGVLMLLVI